ncbi:hypothetical protein ABVT39_026265 [Epinephelus coioides]
MRCLSSLWLIGGLRDKLNRSNLTEVSFMIVNEREAMSRAMFWELKRRAPPDVPVYQQEPFQDDVWEALDGDKDDFLVYDRCGLLTFHIVLPYSFLHYVYVEAAIRATYHKNICNCTIFFILRKKNSQLTFLHVYHHATMIFNWWAGVKYVAGGQSFLIGLINSLVHVVMYLYYGLAALGPSMSKYLWWKRYLTSLQLLQFFIVTIHTTYNLFADCDFPDSMNMVVCAYSFSLIALFSNFYYQSYLTKKRSKET